MKKNNFFARLFQGFLGVIMVTNLLLAAAPVTLAQSAAPTISKEERCAKFKEQFQINGSNIIGDLPLVCSAEDMVVQIINYLLLLSGSVTVLFLIIGGFWYLTSAGNDEQAEKGKKTLLNSVIGLVVILLSYTIVKIVSSTLSLGQ